MDSTSRSLTRRMVIMGRPRRYTAKDDHVLVEQVRSKGIRQFSVNRTTLEDVYLALTGDEVTDGYSDAG